MFPVVVGFHDLLHGCSNPDVALFIELYIKDHYVANFYSFLNDGFLYFTFIVSVYHNDFLNVNCAISLLL